MSKRKLISLWFILPLMISGDGIYSSSASQGQPATQRIQFRIATIEEIRGARNTVSVSTVEGPPGTDFSVNLESARFKMNAHFLTDLMEPGIVKVRATLDTRRLYGYSERNLPLFESDTQRENLQLGMDERIVLLPFGRQGSGDNLQIEITPTVSALTTRLPNGTLRPLEIKIAQQSPGGFINVQASRKPHRFSVEASLIEDGREIARGSSDYLIEETQVLTLHQLDPAASGTSWRSMSLSLALSNYTRSRPADEIQLNFDLYRDGQATGKREVILSKWAGVTRLGSSVGYDLSNTSLAGAGKRYELRFKIGLAPGEDPD